MTRDCGTCLHVDTPVFQEPCSACIDDDQLPRWTPRGTRPTVASSHLVPRVEFKKPDDTEGGTCD